MYLSHLDLRHIRNIKAVSLTLHPRCNVFIGQNGSGKTSLLEGIHLLSLGRSFRSRFIRTVIQFEENSLACFAELEEVAEGGKFSIGIEKNKQGEVLCKISRKEATISQLAALLPLQLMLPETLKQLGAGAQERRKLLDWGVFHVKPLFAQTYFRYQRLLKQRNALLKAKRSVDELVAWERDLAHVGEEIAREREAYFEQWLPYLVCVLQSFLPNLKLDFSYNKGWSKSLPLFEAIHQTRVADQRWGYTSVGPHRAEIAITMEGHSAAQVLSRGQQKLLICALHLAQGKHLKEQHHKQCLYLMDDMASELDSNNRKKVLLELARQGQQVFLTGAEEKVWEEEITCMEAQWFHVEQGGVRCF